jgi:ech hydrogenase subunit A
MLVTTYILILAPLALGVVAAACPGRRTRAAAVTAAGGVIAMAAVALVLAAGRGAGGSPWRAELFLPGELAWLSHLLEWAAVAAFVLIGARLRDGIVLVFGLLQAALCLAGEWIGGRHAAASAATFLVDPLGLILVLIVSVIGSVILIYAIGYMRHHAEHAPSTAASERRFFFVLLSFLGLMNGLALANDLRWLSVFWELTTLCSFALIAHDGTTEARASARRALQINAFGGAALILGAVLAEHQAASGSLSALIATKALIPMALLCLAAMTKSAQMPFQSWLLGAMVAPTPVSALLHSATMVKAGSYLVLRLAPAMASTQLSQLMAVAGAFTFAATAALAVGQSNAKKVLAYSTISNLGLIVACAGINTPLAYAGALFIFGFHAASKGLLFLCVGTIEQRIGSRDIEDMGGIMYLMPVTTVIALAGMLNMLLVPFGMLVSKWLAMESAIGSPVVLVLVIAGSALTVVFWAKWIGRIQTASYHRRFRYEGLPFSMLASMLALILPVFAAGMVTLPLYNHVARPLALLAYPQASAASLAALADVGRTLAWPFYLFLGVAAAAAALSLHGLTGRHVRPPFMCGENILSADRSYTFRSLMDASVTAWSGTYYMRGVFDEQRLTFWGNLLAGLILISMFGLIGAI